MMLNLGFRFGKSHGPIGLDMGHDAIKMTQLRLVQGTPELWEARKTSGVKGHGGFESSASMVQSIKELLEEGDFQGRDCISCLPNSKLRITSVRIDQADHAKTGASLYKEAAYRFGLDPDKDSIRYLPAGKVRQGNALKQEMILFATDSDTIRHHIDMLEAAGLVPQGIDPLPCALLRGLDYQDTALSGQTRTIVYVDVGCCFTTIALGREGQLCFVKQIELGAERFDQVIADKLGVDKTEAHALRLKLQGQVADPGVGTPSHPALPSAQPGPAQEESDASARLEHATRQNLVDCIRSVAGELAHELSRCLRYYTVTFRGQRIQRVVLSGGGANEGILLDTLRAQLGCTVCSADSLSGPIGTQLKSGPGDNANEWVVSWGLALKHLLRAERSPGQDEAARSLVAAGQKAEY